MFHPYFLVPRVAHHVRLSILSDVNTDVATQEGHFCRIPRTESSDAQRLVFPFAVPQLTILESNPFLKIDLTLHKNRCGKSINRYRKIDCQEKSAYENRLQKIENQWSKIEIPPYLHHHHCAPEQK